MSNDKNLATQGLVLKEPSIFELSREGRTGFSLPSGQCSQESRIPEKFLRKIQPRLPEISEVDVIRHFTRLSRLNFGVDLGMYPLGSCTMKYNPRINEDIAAMPDFENIHPYFPEELVQGALKLMFLLERSLSSLSGMHAVTLQPAAGAHGEFTGMKIIRAALKHRGEVRNRVMIPVTAHGTNPASCSMNGYKTIPVNCSDEGIISTSEVEKLMNNDVAALMVTNPNTLGLFERNIVDISRIVHEKGGFIYCDGANFNAIIGKTTYGKMGVDVVQFNLHKTFSTPHGGGGPGSGPVGVVKELEPFLPVPGIACDESGKFRFDYNRPESIGRIKSFYGHFNVMIKAYAYIREMGLSGLAKAAEMAVLNANYLRVRLREYYNLPYNRVCMHEFVLSDRLQKKSGITTMDIAKRLMDYGFHPPTVYFPLVVDGAIMIEPTESESIETLNNFTAAMAEIARDAEENPDLLHSAPVKTHVGRLDEVEAARHPKANYFRL
jgi:glycine dehydrogenase subunit 2